MSSLKVDGPFWVEKTCVLVPAGVGSGQSVAGVGDAPKALVEAGLEAVVESAGWKLERPTTANYEASSEATAAENQNFEKIKLASKIGPELRRIFDIAKTSAEENKFVLTVGGDHGVAAASIAAMLTRYPDLAVVWVDAHADCNTPSTSPSGNYHGMPAAHLMGWFEHPYDEIPGFEWIKQAPALPQKNLAFIALRDVDKGEKVRLAKSEIKCFTMQHIDKLGIAAVVNEVLKHIDPDERRPIHLSFDIDACDPSIAPGTGTKARGGLTFREAHSIVELLHATRRLVSMDLVEINPSLDDADQVLHGDTPLISPIATKTVRLGLELISSAVGSVTL